jgi:probable HAF family extracellular repeat protein
MLFRRSTTVLAVFCLAFCDVASLSAAVLYTVTDLGAGIASGINNSGQVVGHHGARAFLYSNGTTTDLSALLAGQWYSAATGINSSGQVVGYGATGGTLDTDCAFLYSNGMMSEPGTLPDYNCIGSAAFGINDSGQVVGTAYTDTEAAHAFLYSNGKMTDLSASFGMSGARSINANGQVVGYGANRVTGLDHAFLYSNGTMTDLGTLPYTQYTQQSDAFGINRNGQVVGDASGFDSQSNGYEHAFLYSNGQMSDLGTLPSPYKSASSARSINTSGQVVGWSDWYYGTGNTYHAFLYSNGTMTDLNSLVDSASGWTLEYANAINDNGWIVGQGINSAGQTDAFLLTPIPEPSNLALLGIGAINLLTYAWRRQARMLLRQYGLPDNHRPVTATTWSTEDDLLPKKDSRAASCFGVRAISLQPCILRIRCRIARSFRSAKPRADGSHSIVG